MATGIVRQGTVTLNLYSAHQPSFNPTRSRSADALADTSHPTPRPSAFQTLYCPLTASLRLPVHHVRARFNLVGDIFLMPQPQRVVSASQHVASPGDGSSDAGEGKAEELLLEDSDGMSMQKFEGRGEVICLRVTARPVITRHEAYAGQTSLSSISSDLSLHYTQSEAWKPDLPDLDALPPDLEMLFDRLYRRSTQSAATQHLLMTYLLCALDELDGSEDAAVASRVPIEVAVRETKTTDGWVKYSGMADYVVGAKSDMSGSGNRSSHHLTHPSLLVHSSPHLFETVALALSLSLLPLSSSNSPIPSKIHFVHHTPPTFPFQPGTFHFGYVSRPAVPGPATMAVSKPVPSSEMGGKDGVDEDNVGEIFRWFIATAIVAMGSQTPIQKKNAGKRLWFGGGRFGNFNFTPMGDALDVDHGSVLHL
ncbi:hypothetical protein DFS34DRAFT_633808 [Phlyctochytrium arcticum]|nr:hypothetical protein DFS34DRAFT_633808 [Phlyctochytrium arcticum]